MKHTITLEIAGTKFRLVSDAGGEHLQALAAAVNERVERLGRGGSRNVPSGQLLALCALELADELATAQNKLSEVERLTKTTLGAAIARIDSRLADASKPPPAP